MGGGQGYAYGALNYPAMDGFAGSTTTGVHPPPGRSIMARAHYRKSSVRPQWKRQRFVHGRSLLGLGRAQANQVVFSQLAAAVDSLCDVPGFGQLGGAVMSRMGIVRIELGSQMGKSYLGSFFVIPITVSL
jgi:hypothetical protein